jgi:hypothetical protein
VFDLSEEEESIWRTVIDALRSKGATPSEAFDGAYLVIQAYRCQRDGLASQQVAKDEDTVP